MSVVTTATERKPRHTWTKEETDKLKGLYHEYGNNVASIHMELGNDLTMDQIKGKLKTLGLLKKVETVNKKTKTVTDDENKSDDSDSD